MIRQRQLKPGESRRITIPVRLNLCARCGVSWCSGRLTLGAEPEIPESCQTCKSKSWRTPKGSVKLGRPFGGARKQNAS